MVVPSLAIGGAVGVLLSGGYVWWEVGRFATPQVAVTRFEERKLLAAYTVGLFAGVPLSVAFLLFSLAIANGALLGGAVFLVGLAGGSELAQYLVLRTGYWKGVAGPFYALALRAGIGGILALTVVTTYLGGSPLELAAAPATAVAALAVVALPVTAGLLTLAPPRRTARPGFRPISGILFGVVGFFLLGLGGLAGSSGALLGGVVALAGSALVYRRLRGMLDDIPPPGGAPPPPKEAGPLAYGRTEAPLSGTPRRPR